MMIPVLWLAALAAGPGCIPVAEDRILAKDLAEADRIFAALPPDTFIGYSPVPGLRRIFGAAELQRIAAKNGLTGMPDQGVCFERLLMTLSRENVLAAMENSLNKPEARIEVVEFSRYALPPGTIEFPMSGLAPPSTSSTAVRWRGSVVSSDGHKYSIWAMVKILAKGTRVVATEDLKPGVPVLPGQLRVEEFEGFPGAGQWVARIEDAAGKTPRRQIAAGTLLTQVLLEMPQEVQRGDTVRVELRSGPVVLRTDAVAQTAGRRGDTVTVKNPTSGKVFPARVEGKSQVSALTSK